MEWYFSLVTLTDLYMCRAGLSASAELLVLLVSILISIAGRARRHCTQGSHDSGERRGGFQEEIPG